MKRVGSVKGWKNVMRGTPEELLTIAMRLEAEGRTNFTYHGPSLTGGLAALWIGGSPKTLRPVCGARTRAGGECQAKAVRGGRRCRMHGGLSTGPKTEAGRARIAESNRRRVQLVDKLMTEITEMRAASAERNACLPKPASK